MERQHLDALDIAQCRHEAGETVDVLDAIGEILERERIGSRSAASAARAASRSSSTGSTGCPVALQMRLRQPRLDVEQDEVDGIEVLV
jgi:hypothetical protein